MLDVSLGSAYSSDIDKDNTARDVFRMHQYAPISQPAIACSKILIETLAQGVKYV